MTVNAVVLAGGKNKAEMRALTGVENRALTMLGTRSMLDYVTTALDQSHSIGQVFVVGEVPPSSRYTQIAGGATLIENLLAGLNAAASGGSSERILVSTSDIPFLTPESVEDFVRQGLASGADLCCSYAALTDCLAKYPEMKRTAVKLREGRFTLGNLMLVNPVPLLAHPEIIEAAYAARKSPVQVAKLLGLGLLGRLLLAQTVSPSVLPVAALEQAVSRLLGGIHAAAILSTYPEIGTDVDKLEDVVIARRLLGEA